mgnify:CR=1 FL=1
MAKNLVIVESPAKARTVSRYLGNDYEVVASVGHVRDLPSKRMAVDIANDFRPEYEIMPGKKTIMQNLKRLAKNSEIVYLATDPDREGEAISWHIMEAISAKITAKRVIFHEITEQGIKEAFKNPTSLNMKLVNAQQARRILDRVVGYELSPLLWKKFTGGFRLGLSAGRVQSVALKLIVERERAVANFKPQEYWNISVHLSKEKLKGDVPFSARISGSKRYKEDEAITIENNLRSSAFKVTKIRTTVSKSKAHAPFTTSTLQQEASRKIGGFSVSRTMRVAQQLYEGVALGKDGETGLITYMRTDSTSLSTTAISEMNGFIEEKYGVRYIGSGPRKSRRKSPVAAQEAHEAIRPTDVAIVPSEIKEYLEKDMFRLYELIWSRSVSCQMVPAILDTTTFDIRAGQYLFRSNGSMVKFSGFMQVYVESGDDEAAEKESKQGDKILPALNKGEKLKLLDIDPEQHFTQPPPRFSEAMLVKKLEEEGVGRPSTYAAIISVIKDRAYVENEERRLAPTKLGYLVSDLLLEHFPGFMTTKFTADMESQLDQIEVGETEWVKTLQSFYTPFKADLDEAEKKIGDSEVEETDEVCDKCSQPMIVKWGRFGKFMACSGYPDCKNTKQIAKEGSDGKAVSESTTVEGTCDKCQSSLVLKVGRFGKFIACSNYPDCKFTKPIDLGIKCPKDDCKGKIAARRSKKGRMFYGCTAYPNCDFVSWDKPVSEPCPQCNNSYTVEKWKKNEGVSIICPVSECDYKKPAVA